MFTGIIEETGSVEVSGAKFSVRCSAVLSDLTTGASIAVNGVCLTAVDIRADGFTADLAPETLERSNLGDLKAGDRFKSDRFEVTEKQLIEFAHKFDPQMSIISLNYRHLRHVCALTLTGKGATFAVGKAEHCGPALRPSIRDPS